LLELAHGAGFVYRAARTPRTRGHVSLYAFDEQERLIAIADGEGRLDMPILRGRGDVRRVLAGTRDAIDPATGPNDVSVYANDPQDGDADGVGRELERALRTCDGPDESGCSSSMLAPYYRSVAHATADTDHDGLRDGDELFGVAARGLDFPAWGADPRHKDVFVEVDRQERVEAPGLSESDIAGIAGYFAGGSASDLKNPDQLPGVRLHLDIGSTPQLAAHAGLFGDWGGSDVAESGDYKEARGTDFTPERRGYFRYALLTRRGTGQSSGAALTVNRDFHRVSLFAHELGHTLGLKHHGADDWGAYNCKPNYFSLMNYVFQNRGDVGFSRRSGTRLDPARILESAGPYGIPARALRESPFDFDVMAGGVDWNRDGIISHAPVRAALTWATWKSCDAAGRGRITLAKDVRDATPVLVRAGANLYALWLDREGHVQERHAAYPCPRATPRDSCLQWSPSAALPVPHALRHIAAVEQDAGSIALAYVREDRALGVSVLRLDAASPSLVSDVALPEDARSDHAPAIVWQQVDAARYGVARVLSVFYRAAGDTGELVQASTDRADRPFQLRAVLDANGNALSSARGPTLAALGTGELCAVFPDVEGYARFFCYDARSDAFTDLSRAAFYAGLGPFSAGEVGIAYHYYRDADGLPVTDDASRGAVYLAFTEVDPDSKRYSDIPSLLISQWLSAAHAARERIDFRWRGRLIDQWTTLAPATRVAFYEDESSDGLAALMNVHHSNGSSQIDFLPVADGSFDAALGAGNDFQIMERGICAVLRGNAICGAN
jgi:hypothetical protein